jgi:hypothetical protein
MKTVIWNRGNGYEGAILCNTGKAIVLNPKPTKAAAQKGLNDIENEWGPDFKKKEGRIPMTETNPETGAITQLAHWENLGR